MEDFEIQEDLKKSIQNLSFELGIVKSGLSRIQWKLGLKGEFDEEWDEDKIDSLEYQSRKENSKWSTEEEREQLDARILSIQHEMEILKRVLKRHPKQFSEIAFWRHHDLRKKKSYLLKKRFGYGADVDLNKLFHDKFKDNILSGKLSSNFLASNSYSILSTQFKPNTEFGDKDVSVRLSMDGQLIMVRLLKGSEEIDESRIILHEKEEKTLRSYSDFLASKNAPIKKVFYGLMRIGIFSVLTALIIKYALL